MLQLVEVRTRQGDLLSLPLEDDSSGFRVAEIEGLDPVKATLVSSSFANMDGEEYQSSRREPRNIKLQIELDPDPETDTVYGLRKQIYKFFMPKSEVSFRFYMSDGLEVDIVGRVETCESALFTQEPAVDISVMCFKPDFYELTPELVEGTTTSGETPITIEYAGNIETGIQLTLNVDRTLPEFSVFHVPPNDETVQLDFDSDPLEPGDVLTISTVRGSKGAILTRAGVESSVLYGISPQSKWIELQPGTNTIRVYAEGADIPLTIQYINKYGGL
ncbi:minor tail protein [Streptomyces phage Scap1]|uniref:Minor tail protein n=1 Tax=Streptomyces phage Scap1 TaxID=2041354 RepID=A0A2D1GNP2_9CAUD|nr:minor tail protein [Streptomyces phage Scap1]ATN93669.1 minor tail protein [Streptomyces phage Scap1]